MKNEDTMGSLTAKQTEDSDSEMDDIKQFTVPQTEEDESEDEMEASREFSSKPTQINTELSHKQDEDELEEDDLDFEPSSETLLKDNITKEIKTGKEIKLVINVQLDELIKTLRKLTKKKTRKKDIEDTEIEDIEENPKKKRTKKKKKKVKKKAKKKKKTFGKKKKNDEEDDTEDKSLLDNLF